MIAVADNSLGHNSTNHALPHAHPVSAIVFESDFPSPAPRFSSRMKSAKGEGEIEAEIYETIIGPRVSRFNHPENRAYVRKNLRR